jgi:hypothetical protein
MLEQDGKGGKSAQGVKVNRWAPYRQASWWRRFGFTFTERLIPLRRCRDPEGIQTQVSLILNASTPNCVSTRGHRLPLRRKKNICIQNLCHPSDLVFCRIQAAKQRFLAPGPWRLPHRSGAVQNANTARKSRNRRYAYPESA